MRIIKIAALFSLPIVAAATTQTLAANYGSSANGGGSPGYNRGVATDYRLKKHHNVKKLHAQVKPKATKKHAQAKPKAAKPSGAAAPAAAPAAAAPAAAAPAATGQAGGGVAKQPMGRP
jgi:hypothetical protein